MFTALSVIHPKIHPKWMSDSFQYTGAVFAFCSRSVSVLLKRFGLYSFYKVSVCRACRSLIASQKAKRKPSRIALHRTCPVSVFIMILVSPPNAGVMEVRFVA
jgi:hypothetical protein